VIIAPEETLAELAMAAGAGVTKILPCSSIQQRQPCQLHDCSSSRQLVTVLPPPPPIHCREEILMAPQHYLCAWPRRFRPPRLAPFLRHCRPSHSRCVVITRPTN
jgi:hypothetical protein